MPEVEDGMGFSGLIPTRREAEEDRLYARIRQLEGEVKDRTTERDYHIRVGDQLAANVRTLAAALKEAQRFISYFAGETGGTFVGPGTPQSCLEQIVTALHYDGHDTNSLTVGELRRAL